MKKAIIRPPVHESYQRHRRQRTWQIILPVVLAALFFCVLIVLVNVATFRDGADVARWAAVSTILISMPVILGSLVLLVIVGGLAYLMARLLQVAPTYTGQAQDFAHKIAGLARRIADGAVKPVMFLNGTGASIKALLGRK